MTSPLLSLPLELRQKIYTHLLLTQSPTPSYSIPPSGPPGPFRDGEHIKYNPPCPRGGNLFSSSPLLLANKQLRFEILQTFHHLLNANPQAHNPGDHPPAMPLPYVLDIFAPSVNEMTTTWLSLPAPPVVYPNMTVPVRAYVRLNEPRIMNPAWRGNGGPGYVAQNLLRVIGRWCAQGLLFSENLTACPMDENDPSKRVKIGTLEVVYVPWAKGEPLTRAAAEAKYGRQETHWAESRLKQPAGWYHWGNLTATLDSIVRTGLLAGYVERIWARIEGGGVEEEEGWEVVEVEEQQKRKDAEEWAGYGWRLGRKYHKRYRLEDLQGQ